jgi:hypothetical protein
VVRRRHARPLREGRAAGALSREHPLLLLRMLLLRMLLLWMLLLRMLRVLERDGHKAPRARVHRPLLRCVLAAKPRAAAAAAAGVAAAAAARTNGAPGPRRERLPDARRGLDRRVAAVAAGRMRVATLPQQGARVCGIRLRCEMGLEGQCGFPIVAPCLNQIA